MRLVMRPHPADPRPCSWVVQGIRNGDGGRGGGGWSVMLLERVECAGEWWGGLELDGGREGLNGWREQRWDEKEVWKGTK